jgi:hypothetical protein
MARHTHVQTIKKPAPNSVEAGFLIHAVSLRP